MKNEIVDNSDNINDIYGNIESLINNSKTRIYTSVNTEILNLYWNIGKIIIDIQEGESRAKYGKNVLKDLSEKLMKEFGSGFSERNLEMMRKFCCFFQNSQTVSAKLSWSHYVELIIISDESKRNFYMHECINSR